MQFYSNNLKAIKEWKLCKINQTSTKTQTLDLHWQVNMLTFLIGLTSSHFQTESFLFLSAWS